MGKPSAPPAPDYAALATAQGQANLQTSAANDASNRVNQYTPYGSSTWSTAPGADPLNPKTGDYSQTVALSPEQQQLYNSQNQISQSYLNTAQSGLNQVGSSMGSPFNPTGLPALSGAPGVSNTANPYMPYSGYSGPGYGPQSSLNMSQVPQLGTDYSAMAKQTTDALLSRINPTLDANTESMNSALANQGITAGSTAYNRQSNLDSQARNDAQQQAILGGDQEAQQLQQQAMQQQAQMYGQALSSGNFANSAQAQAYGQGLGSAQFGNQAAGQQFSQQQSIDQLLNQYGLSSTSLNNAARGQGYQEQLNTRELPLNETNALRSGAQVQSPTFGSYYTNNAQAAPVFEAGQAQGQYDLGQYQAGQSGFNALLGSAATAAAAYF